MHATKANAFILRRAFVSVSRRHSVDHSWNSYPSSYSLCMTICQMCISVVQHFLSGLA